MVKVDMIGVTEAAQRAAVHRNTIYRWVEDGTLKPAMKLPGVTGVFMFNGRDVDKLARTRGGQK